MGLKTIFNRHHKLRLLINFLIIIIITVYVSILYESISFAQNRFQNTQFNSLKNELTHYGFTVKLEIPPYANQYGIRPYGLIEGTTKTVWINPVVFELGNAQAVIVHEATHAAQFCAGNKSEFKLLNLALEPPKMTHPYFMRYHNYRREIEAEAYTVQVQSNSFKLAKNLLNSHCSGQNN